MINLQYLKTVSDKRGSIIFMKSGKTLINLVEIKQGFSRGGHFHPFHSAHNLVKGKVAYLEFNTKTNEENEMIFTAPHVINVAPYVAHLLTAKIDSLFVEIFENEYQAIDFPKYRKIVEKDLS